MLEEEAWGVLTKDQFDHFLSLFTKRFGNPAKSKRLSFSFWDHNHNDVDIRIRITDGDPEIMLKLGKWEGESTRVRSEKHVRLQPDADEVFKAYQIFRTLIPGENDCYIYRQNNYIFKTPEFEIKLTCQMGKTDKYHFEVEKKSSTINLDQIVKELGLSEMITITNIEFWDQWNKGLNLKDSELKEEQIIDLIKRYL